MSLKVVVSGINGKMGSLAAKIIESTDGFTLLSGVNDTKSLTKAIATEQPDIVVDFTAASVGMQHAKLIIEAGVHPVIGTTGFTDKEVATLETACEARKLGGIIAPNFSIGAILLMHFAKIAAQYLPQAEIIEGHHPAKEEAPSGTAVKTAELIAKTRHKDFAEINCHEIIVGARGASHRQVPIHSMRLPGLLAEQTVVLGGAGETLRLQHQTIDRKCFMPGLLLACREVVKLKTLLYGLENLILSGNPPA